MASILPLRHAIETPGARALACGRPRGPQAHDRASQRRNREGARMIRRPVWSRFLIVPAPGTILRPLILPPGPTAADTPAQAPGRRFPDIRRPSGPEPGAASTVIRSLRTIPRPAPRRPLRRRGLLASPDRPGLRRRCPGAAFRTDPRKRREVVDGVSPERKRARGLTRPHCGRGPSAGLPDGTDAKRKRRGTRAASLRVPTRFTKRRLS
jgi:hypothetical protein